MFRKTYSYLFSDKVNLLDQDNLNRDPRRKELGSQIADQKRGLLTGKKRGGGGVASSQTYASHSGRAQSSELSLLVLEIKLYDTKNSF